MSSPRHPPSSPRYIPKMEQHHYSWDEGSNGAKPLPIQNQSSVKVPIRASSSPIPYKCPKPPRNFQGQIVGNPYESGVKTSSLPQRSPSVRSNYSCQSSYSDAASTSSLGSSRSSSRDNPPRSPKITTTFANDCSEDGGQSSISYYHTPTSGTRSPKGVFSKENSIDSPSCLLYSGNQTPVSPRRSPHAPRTFVFEAISPMVDSPSRKFEYYEPVSPDDDIDDEGNGYENQSQPPPLSPKLYEHRRQNSKKIMRSTPLEQLNRFSNTNQSCKRSDEWEMTISSNAGGDYQGLGVNNYYMKRDSCVTECTQLSVESETSTIATTTTSFSYSDTSTRQTSSDQTQELSPLVETNAAMRKRRHAINITSNPGYQVLHSSHSTLDRTCSDSVVSLRYRKSTSDLTQDSENDRNKHKHPGESSTPTAGSYKPRRRGSSKGGLAYLASRRSSRESMKSACSNASLVSNDDIGPLAFQASNRGRQRRTSNFLELPVPDHFRPRVCSLPDRPYNPRASDDLYRLRHFSISKGNVVNCGDSIISRRSRSNTSVNSTNSRASERSPFEGSCCGGGYANVDSVPASPEDDDTENYEPPPPPRYRVVMLGDAGVGKTALVNQFMTSEYMHTYDASLDDEFGEKTVSILLDDEESELVFIDHPSVEMSVENSLSTYEPHGCVIVFSIVDKASFRVAEEIINYLWQENYTKDKAVILVGNKADLARSRVITSQEGKSLAASRDAKFIETSSGIQHNVDELLVGTLKQMRLKESREKKASSKMKTSRTHISLQMAKEILHKICLSDISKSKSCENLHVL